MAYELPQMPLYPQGYNFRDPDSTPVKACPVCDEPFVPTKDKGGSFGEQFTLGKAAACEQCLWTSLFTRKEQGATQAEDTVEAISDALAYVHQMTGVIPRANNTWRKAVLNDEFYARAGEDHYVAVLMALLRIPGPMLVNHLFGSWHAALVAAGVFEEGSERRSRGTVSLANDGHLCLSAGERVIDDWLHARKIPHTREPRYPGSLSRGDFLVGDVYLEYFGLAGDARYDERAAQKLELARSAGIEVIPIYPHDLASWGAFSAELEARLPVHAEVPELPELELRTSAPATRPAAHLEHPVVATPGWYKDPFRARRHRWHDGRMWTHHVRIQGGRVISHSPASTPDAEALAKDQPWSAEEYLSWRSHGGELDAVVVAYHCARVDKRENEARAEYDRSMKDWEEYDMPVEYKPQRFTVIENVAPYALKSWGLPEAAMAVHDRWVRFSDVQTRSIPHRELHLLHRSGYEPDLIQVGYARLTPVPTGDPIDQQLPG